MSGCGIYPVALNFLIGTHLGCRVRHRRDPSKISIRSGFFHSSWCEEQLNKKIRAAAEATRYTVVCPFSTKMELMDVKNRLNVPSASHSQPQYCSFPSAPDRSFQLQPPSPLPPPCFFHYPQPQPCYEPTPSPLFGPTHPVVPTTTLFSTALSHLLNFHQCKTKLMKCILSTSFVFQLQLL